jgi:hypothetical protein
VETPDVLELGHGVAQTSSKETGLDVLNGFPFEKYSTPEFHMPLLAVCLHDGLHSLHE